MVSALYLYVTEGTEIIKVKNEEEKKKLVGGKEEINLVCKSEYHRVLKELKDWNINLELRCHSLLSSIVFTKGNILTNMYLILHGSKVIK